MGGDGIPFYIKIQYQPIYILKESLQLIMRKYEIFQSSKFGILNEIESIGLQNIKYLITHRQQ